MPKMRVPTNWQPGPDAGWLEQLVGHLVPEHPGIDPADAVNPIAGMAMGPMSEFLAKWMGKAKVPSNVGDTLLREHVLPPEFHAVGAGDSRPALSAVEAAKERALTSTPDESGVSMQEILDRIKLKNQGQ